MKTFLFGLSFFLFASCSKKISVPIPAEPVRPVLNAILTADSVIYARATLSDRLERGLMTGKPAGFTAPEDAVIRLFEEGQYRETLRPVFLYDQLFWVSTAKVRQGKNYSLKLKIPGYPEVDADDRIPYNNTYDISDAHIFMTDTHYGYQETNLSFALHNTGNRSNYYLFRMFGLRPWYSIENGDTLRYTAKQLVWIDYKHKEPQSIGGNSGYQYFGLLSELPVAPGESALFTLTAGNQPYDTMQLEISVLSEPCYLYISTFEKAVETMDDPTAEKIKVYNNVSNGFGIVGAMAGRSYTLIR